MFWFLNQYSSWLHHSWIHDQCCTGLIFYGFMISKVTRDTRYPLGCILCLPKTLLKSLSSGQIKELSFTRLFSLCYSRFITKTSCSKRPGLFYTYALFSEGLIFRKCFFKCIELSSKV